MRIRLILASSAAWVLLWASPGHAFESETACANAKLRAAAQYSQCLIRVFQQADARGDEASEHGDEPSVDAIARCDERFDRAFERAEADGACRTPGGASTLREPLRAQMETLADNLLAATSCANLVITPGDVATCAINKTMSAIDLAAVVNQLSGLGVTDDTAFWIQAWGGDGSNGNVCCTYGGRGGQGGYAQTTTSLSALESAYGTTELYYYLGLNGTFSADAGGDGGTATLVTVNDLTRGDVALADTLQIAGGGGGGGAGRGKANVCGMDSRIAGGAGGNGASAFFVAGPGQSFTIVAGAHGGPATGPGSGVVKFNSGQGGQIAKGGFSNGGSSEPGGDPTAPLGGRGGNHLSPQIGFVNASGTAVTGGGGRGSDGGLQAGGGAGGGGYTGGGGGNRGNLETGCVSGGGGGGSSFVRQVPGSPTCAAAPTTRPGNPNGIAGFVQITFDLGACGLEANP